MERGLLLRIFSALGILVCGIPPARGFGERAEYPIAVLECAEWKHAGSSSPQVLADALRASGFRVSSLTPEELGAPKSLDAEKFSLVVLPYGEFFPARARGNFLHFLSQGGDFISMGGCAFQRPVLKSGGRWIPVREFIRSQRTHFLDLGSETDEFFLSGDWHPAEKSPDRGTFRWTGKRASVHIVPPIGVPWRLVVEGAIGEEVRNLRREVWWNGSRVGRLDESDIRRWELDMPPVPPGGKPGSELRFECETWRPADLLGTEDYRSVGVAVSAIKVFAADKVEPASPDVFGDFIRPINTADGRARDFLEVRGEQVGVFDAGYPLEQAAVARSATEQTILRRVIKVVGPFHGYAATAMIGSHWYCNSPRDEGRLVPLIRAYDRYGRFRGNIGATVLNYADEYRGSLWGFFGVQNGDLFRRDIPGMLESLVDLASFFARGIFLHESRPEFACYYPEENYRILASISNLSDVTQTAQLEFETYGEALTPVDRESQRLVLAPHSITAATFASRVQKTGADFYRVQVALFLEGRQVDREDTGFFAWRPGKFADSGLPLTWSGGRLGMRGVPGFLLGTQAFYPVYSVADRSPLVVLSDFERMRDYGVHLARSFSWGREKDQTRFQDALVAVGQREGVVNFLEGISGWPAVDSRELEEAKSSARSVADRYRAAPGLMIDTRNEPAFTEKDLESLVPAYAKYIGAASEEAVKGIPLRGAWNDLRVTQSHRFLTSVMHDWLHACAGAIHDSSPGRLVTVGHLQFTNQQHFDRRVSIDQLDFVNQHFYADVKKIRRLSAEMLFMDMTYRGRPTSLGEFGSKTHPAFEKTGHNFDTEEEQILRYAHAMHVAFGLGALFGCNWHWRDPVSCVFPYGLLHQDGVPKRTAKLYRAMSLLFSGANPVAATPEVYVLIPEAHRTGSAWAGVTWATLACIARVMDCQVPVGVIHESDVALLPEEVRVLFWPVPYCPRDETYLQVTEFVRAGGSLYLSGDVSYDEKTRERTRTARLIELCGAEFVEERYPNIRYRKGPPVRIVAATEAIGIGGKVSYPALVVQSAGAKPLLISESGDPLVLWHRLGAGRVLFNVDPVELRWKCDERPRPGETQLYRWFLRRSGIDRLPVEPRTPDFRAMRVPTKERGEVYVLVDLAENRSVQTAQLQGPREELSITLRDHLPGLIHLDRQGRVVAVEAGGEFRAAGMTIAEASAPFILISLDGADVKDSKMLVVVPFGRGEFALDSLADWEEPVLQVGEVQAGAWEKLEGISLRPAETGTFRFHVHNLQEFEMLIICEQGREAECGARVARRLCRPWRLE